MVRACLRALLTAHCSDNIMDRELLSGFFMMYNTALSEELKNII